jgi:DNA-binding GntR family transcriptional regulator
LTVKFEILGKIYPMESPQTEEAYRRLRGSILSLELPPGEPLVERRLEEILSISRTPIRAAIQQLLREGLVHRTGRIYSVAPVDLAELDEAFEFRNLLETSAVLMAAKRKPQANDLLELLESVGAGLDPEIELEKATDFHLSLARLSGNRFLVQALAQVLSRIYRARYLEITRPHGADEAHIDHATLIELVQNGEGERASRLVLKHLQRSRESLLKSLSSGAGMALVGATTPQTINPN